MSRRLMALVLLAACFGCAEPVGKQQWQGAVNSELQETLGVNDLDLYEAACRREMRRWAANVEGRRRTFHLEIERLPEPPPALLGRFTTEKVLPYARRRLDGDDRPPASVSVSVSVVEWAGGDRARVASDSWECGVFRKCGTVTPVTFVRRGGRWLVSEE